MEYYFIIIMTYLSHFSLVWFNFSAMILQQCVRKSSARFQFIDATVFVMNALVCRFGRDKYVMMIFWQNLNNIHSAGLWYFHVWIALSWTSMTTPTLTASFIVLMLLNILYCNTHGDVFNVNYIRVQFIS